MASRILISFIGTGPKESHTNRESRKYRSAPYRFNNETVQTSFVAEAMKFFFKPDKMFLIGTPHSMWEKVYETFSTEENNEETWNDIDEWCKNANHQTPASDLPHKEKIEEAMGAGSKIFLIRYGLDKAQIEENIKIILGIRDYLERGDEIIVDITHGFRSLPLLIMQLILYLKQIESPKVNVSHIYYGMLDVIDELQYAPIVDMSDIINLSDWITGAYSFKSMGSAKQICSLMERDDKSASQMLQSFSDALSLNDLYNLQGKVKSLAGMKCSSDLANLAVKPTIDNFIRTFGKTKKASQFQYELARWQMDRMNYFAAYTTLVECIITKICEDSGLDWKEYNHRQNVRDALNKRNNKINVSKAQEYDPFDNNLVYSNNLENTFRAINPIRNALVHNSDNRDNKQMITALKNAVSNLKSEITDNTAYNK